MALGSADGESIITREELERKTAQWLLKEDAASDQAFDKAAHAYLGKLHYKLYKYQGTQIARPKAKTVCA